MKTLLLFSFLTISFFCYSQSDKIIISKLSQIMLEKNYSSSEIAELSKYPEKLAILDYIYSKSFEVSGQTPVSNEKFEKIDIIKYDLTRKLDSDVLVFDEASGLSIVLYSLNKMEEDKKKLMPSLSKTDPSSKISN